MLQSIYPSVTKAIKNQFQIDALNDFTAFPLLMGILFMGDGTVSKRAELLLWLVAMHKNTPYLERLGHT
jgi:hypothetical protein